MAFNYPNAPTDGQIFTDAASGAQYIYKTNPGAWMQTSAAQINLGAQTRSRVVNGAMQISQENGDTGTAVNGGYPVDQWLLSYSGPTGVTGLRLTPGGTNQRGLAIQFTVAKPSLAAGDLGMLVQRIEGNKLADFYWGSASARQAVLRFDIFSQVAGTFPISVRNGAVDRSWLGSYTIAAGEVNKYVTKTLVIPGDVTGTWPVDNTLGMTIAFGFVIGPTYVGVPGWQAGSVLAPPGMTNGAAVIGSFFLANVGLYADPQNTGAAPPWQMPDEAQELAACQRYFQWVAFQYYGPVSSAIAYLGLGKMAVTMRIGPAVGGAIHLGAAAFPATPGVFVVFNFLGGGISENRTANATTTGYFQTVAAANARM